MSTSGTVLVSPFVRRARLVLVGSLVSFCLCTIFYLSDESTSGTGAKTRSSRSLQAAEHGVPIHRSKSLSESDGAGGPGGLGGEVVFDLAAVERAAAEQVERPRGRHDSDDNPRSFQTFFSNMSTRFCDVIPIDGDRVPTLPFLDACRNVLPIFDRMNPTAFAPVKSDISGNIQRIHRKYATNPVKFKTLQDIVLADIAANQHQDSQSTSLAILWLKRTVDFVVEFLKEFRLSRDDLTEGVMAAYSRTLRPYHGWLLRGMFAVALRAVPDKADFARHLALNEADLLEPNFEQQLHADLDQCLNAQEQLCRLLTDFLVVQGLDRDDQV